MLIVIRVNASSVLYLILSGYLLKWVRVPGQSGEARIFLIQDDNLTAEVPLRRSILQSTLRQKYRSTGRHNPQRDGGPEKGLYRLHPIALMDSQIYYRPADLQTAEYLENRLGYRSAWAHSKTRHDGREVSEGEQERFIPLLSKQEIMQLPDEAVIGFTGNLPPFQGQRIDWRRIFKARQKIAPPPLPVLPKLEETLEVSTQQQPPPPAFTYISPNGL